MNWFSYQLKMLLTVYKLLSISIHHICWLSTLSNYVFNPLTSKPAKTSTDQMKGFDLRLLIKLEKDLTEVNRAWKNSKKENAILFFFLKPFK